MSMIFHFGLFMTLWVWCCIGGGRARNISNVKCLPFGERATHVARRPCCLNAYFNPTMMFWFFSCAMLDIIPRAVKCHWMFLIGFGFCMRLSSTIHWLQSYLSIFWTKIHLTFYPDPFKIRMIKVGVFPLYNLTALPLFNPQQWGPVVTMPQRLWYAALSNFCGRILTDFWGFTQKNAENALVYTQAKQKRLRAKGLLITSRSSPSL